VNPRQFLLIGGIILLALGIVGYLEGTARLLGDFLWFDDGENIAHTVLGIVAIAAAFVLPTSAQRLLTILVAILGLATGLYGFILPSDTANFFGVANLENPADNVLHLVVGVWGLFAAFGPQGRTVTTRTA
jgi:hypothetical protein